jgi:uncharacterized membrane protein YccC
MASALVIGFVCYTTVIAPASVITALARKIDAPIRSADQHDRDAGHQHVGERQRQEVLPADFHDLILAVARQRPAHDDL